VQPTPLRLAIEPLSYAKKNNHRNRQCCCCDHFCFVGPCGSYRSSYGVGRRRIPQDQSDRTSKRRHPNFRCRGHIQRSLVRLPFEYSPCLADRERTAGLARRPAELAERTLRIRCYWGRWKLHVQRSLFCRWKKDPVLGLRPILACRNHLNPSRRLPDAG